MRSFLILPILFVGFSGSLSAGVNPDGSYSESIPIQIPAGRNGVQPNLSLSYNSNGGNGIAGVGWSMQGLPVITRMNYGRGINYDGQDTYAGPEGRLIMVAGASTPLSNPPIYHSENESWSKYEPLGSDNLALNSGNKCGDSACTWKVTDRSGMVYVYGGTNGASVGAIDASGNPINSGSIRVWALRSVTDLNGNYYEVEYYVDAGQYYPKRIRYTLGGGGSKNYTITFSYDQSSRPDKDISYAQSSFVQTKWRLSEILVEAQQPIWWIFSWTVQVRRYALDYNISSSSGFSRICSFKQFNADNSLAQEIIPTWQNGVETNADGSGFTPVFYNTVRGGDNIVESGFSEYLDLNGDGLIDHLWSRWINGGWERGAVLNTGNGWVSAPQYTPVFYNTVRDFYGTIVEGGFSKYIDLNGDGLPDHLWSRWKDGTWERGAVLNTGNGWVSAPQYTPVFYNTVRGADNIIESGFSEYLDLNGDGLIDHLWSRWINGGWERGAVLNTGNGWVSAPQYTPVFLILPPFSRGG